MNGTRSGEYEYFEMDVDPQENKIFSPSYLFPAVPCNAAPNSAADAIFPTGNAESPFVMATPENLKAAMALIAEKRKN